MTTSGESVCKQEQPTVSSMNPKFYAQFLDTKR